MIIDNSVDVTHMGYIRLCIATHCLQIPTFECLAVYAHRTQLE